MKSQNIFERYEMKYIVTDAQRDAILRETAAHLKGDQYGQSTICNLYYDVPSYTLIRRSLEKPAYKEKLRVRSYGVARPDSKVFVELKKKAYGIVYKRRVSLPEREAMFYLGSDAMGGLPGQIGREIDYFRGFYEGLAPKMFISYEREAFYDTDDDSFRVTFDRHILWRTDDLSLTKGAYGREVLSAGYSLMELKVGAALPLWMVSVLSRHRIYQTSFSKYGKAYQDMTALSGQPVYCYHTLPRKDVSTGQYEKRRALVNHAAAVL